MPDIRRRDSTIAVGRHNPACLGRIPGTFAPDVVRRRSSWTLWLIAVLRAFFLPSGLFLLLCSSLAWYSNLLDAKSPEK